MNRFRIELATIFTVSVFVFTAFNVDAQSLILDQVQQDRCTRLTTAIDSRITRYESSKQTYINKYTAIVESVSTRLTNLETKGLDVSILRADLQFLNQNIIEFGLLYDQFINEFNATKDYACRTSEGEFVDQLQNARVNLQTAKQKGIEIREFINNTIRQDLRNLKTTI